MSRESQRAKMTDLKEKGKVASKVEKMARAKEGGGKENKGGKGKGSNEVCWTCSKPGHL